MLTSYGRLTPAQLFALVIGIVYLAVGLIGFAVTGFNGWFEQGAAEKLLVFPLNGIHNVVHIGLGLVWMLSSSSFKGAKTINLLFGIVLGLVAILGFIGAAKWLAIEGASSSDNYLHIVTALVALYLGVAGPGGRPTRDGR